MAPTESTILSSSSLDNLDDTVSVFKVDVKDNDYDDDDDVEDLGVLKMNEEEDEVVFFHKKHATSMINEQGQLETLYKTEKDHSYHHHHQQQQQQDKPPTKGRRFKYKWWHTIFGCSLISLIGCILQVFVLPPSYGGLLEPAQEVSKRTFSSSSKRGCDDGLEYCICPRETVCATSKLYMILLVIARLLAFFDYPLYMMMFLSKAHNLNNVLRRTILCWWIGFADMHHIHHLFGCIIGIESIFHSFFHILRWSLRENDIKLLYQSRTGITGMIVAISTMLTVWPMIIPTLKKRLSFEIRKGLHYLSWIWAVALCYHAPARIYWLIGIPATIYLVDWVICLSWKTTIIDTVMFERYGEDGVIVSILTFIAILRECFILASLFKNDFSLTHSLTLSLSHTHTHTHTLTLSLHI